jgi:hypothetical protein
MDALVMNPDGDLMNYSHIEMIINIICALFIGFILSIIYKYTHKGLSYSQSFNHTIIFVTLIVAIVMMVIGGSLARAFALVGALSIIRFRTVLKDTKDLSFIFGALALGMAAGTSNYFLAGFGTLMVAGTALFLSFTNFASVYKSEFILRFRFNQNGDSEAYLRTIEETCKRSNLLHIEPSGDNESLSLTYDVALRDETSDKDLVKKISALPDISEAVLIAAKNDIDY